MSHYLSEKHLKGLDHHKYASVSFSILDKYIMNSFWNSLIGFVPLWVAPNLLTTIGFFANIVACSSVVVGLNSTSEDSYMFQYLICSAGIFIYQTLDSLDGKQARRTSSSSPLGEYFDHGMDSYSLNLYFLILAACLNLQPSLSTLLFFASFVSAFYCSHWHAYVFGFIEFGTVDVTEAELALAGVSLLNYLFSSSFWEQTLFVYKRKDLALLIATLSITTSIFRNFYKVLIVNKKPTIAGTSVISPLFPLFTTLIIMFYTFQNTSLYFRFPILFVLLFGSIFCKITNSLIIAHMCKQPLKFTDSLFLLPLINILNSKYPIFNDFFLLALTTLISTLLLASFFAQICREIATYKKINIFTIPYPPPPLSAPEKSGSSPSSKSVTDSPNRIITRARSSRKD